MLDNSTIFSIYVLLGVFIVLTAILSIIKPKFVLRPKINGTSEIQWDKLVAYSSIISLVSSILVLISYDKFREIYLNKSITQDNNIYIN